MARPRRDTDSDELFLQQTSTSPTSGSAIIQPLRISKGSPSPAHAEQLAAFPSPRRPTFPGPSGPSAQLPYPDRPAAERVAQQRQNSLPQFSPEFRENRPPYPDGKSKSPPPSFGRQTGVTPIDSFPQPPAGKQREGRPQRVGKVAAAALIPPESPGGPEPPPKDEGGPIHDPEQLNPFPEYHQQFWPPSFGRYRPGSTASTNTTYGRRGSPVPPETPMTATQEVPPSRIGDFPSIPSGAAREPAQAKRTQSPAQGLRHPTPTRQPQQSPPPQAAQQIRRPWTPTETPGDNPHGPPTVYQGPSRAETFAPPAAAASAPKTAPASKTAPTPKAVPAPKAAPPARAAPAAPVFQSSQQPVKQPPQQYPQPPQQYPQPPPAVVSVAPSAPPPSRDRKGASPPPVGRTPANAHVPPPIDRTPANVHDAHAAALEQDFQRMNMEEPPPSYASLSSGTAAAITALQPGPSTGLTAQGYPDEKHTVVLGAAAPEPPRNHPAFQNQPTPVTSHSTGPTGTTRAQTQSPLQNLQRSSTGPQQQPQGQTPPLQQGPGPAPGQLPGPLPGQQQVQQPQPQPQPQQQPHPHPGVSTTPQQQQQAFAQQGHGQQTFTPPPVGGPSAPSPLPPDWMAHLDQSSGHYYYIHIPTQRTQWDPPQPEPVQAPPPTPGFPPSTPGFPPQTPGFPNGAANFPPQIPGFPPPTPGFPPPQTPGFPPPQTPGFPPPQTPGFPPPQTPGFPPPQTPGFPPPQTPGFPPPQTPGFPPSLGSPGLPPMYYQEMAFGPPPPLQQTPSFPMQLPLAGIIMYQIVPSNGEYFGPYLRYTNMDIDLGIWLGSVLIISADPQPPNVHLHQSQDLSPNPRQLKANPIYTHRTWTFYRYDIDIQMAEIPTQWTYAVTSNTGCIRFEFLVAGKHERTWRWVAHSCNDFSVSVKPEEKAKLNGPGHMWNDLMQKHHETGGFHVQVGGGDQIYADRMWRELPLLREWLQIKGKENRKNAPWTPNHEEEVTHAYFHYYSSTFDQSHIREAWASIPHIFQLDDHDIFDGFGSYPEYMQFSHMFKNIGRIAIHWYLLFQHHTTLDILRATPDERDLFTITGTGWHFIKYLGPAVVVIGADTRSERNPHQIMAGSTYQGLFPRIANLPQGVQHIVLMLAVPIVYPRLEVAESVVNTVATSKKAVTGTYNLIGKVMGSAAGVVGAKQVVGAGFSSVKQAFGKSGLMSSVVSVFGEVDLLDDLRDHWTHESKDLERTYLVRTLQGIAHQRGFRFTFLSGDVHCCGAGLFHDPSRPTDHKTMYQIITSAIVNVPPPPLVLKMLHSSSIKPLYVPQNGMRSTHSHSDTKEDMIELFQNDVTGGLKEGKKLMGRRNYVIFVAFEPTGMMPPGMIKPGMGGPLSLAVDFIVQGEGMYPAVKYGPVVVPRVEYGQ